MNVWEKSIRSLWVVPLHQPQASSIVHRTWTGNSFHTLSVRRQGMRSDLSESAHSFLIDDFPGTCDSYLLPWKQSAWPLRKEGYYT